MIKLITEHYIEIAYIACALLGGIMHWMKKSFNGETESKITEWFGSHNLPATIYTLIVFIFAIIGSLAGDIINSQTGFWAAMYTGFVTGFAIDSGFNRDMSSVNRDLIKSRGEIRELIGVDEEPPKREVIAVSKPVKHPSQYAEVVVTEDVLKLDAPTKPQLTVEERRETLRNKLKS